MALFNFLTKEIAIDLGTANTVIMYNDKVVVNEPSIVAIDNTTNTVMAVGKKAMMMHGKTHEHIKTIIPLRDGVIADFYAAEIMIREFIKMIPWKNNLINYSYRMVIGIPSGITEVEMRAVHDSAEQAGAKEVKLIYEPMAAALGIGIDVLDNTGNMIVDIGGGTTEVAVIALGGIISNKSIRIGGTELNEDIQDYMKRAHNLSIGERTAERIKIDVGAAIPNIENPPEPIEVNGRDIITGIPRSVQVNHEEIAHAIDKTISKIEDTVISALENTPPELSADILQNGVYLTGGSSLLRGLDKRLSSRIKLKVQLGEDPLLAVARGTSVALKNFNKFPFLI